MSNVGAIVPFVRRVLVAGENKESFETVTVHCMSGLLERHQVGATPDSDRVSSVPR